MNFYVKEDICPTCKREDKEIHLGKASAGWTFMFQYNNGEYYKNVPEMREWLKDKRIFDECDEEVTYADFWKTVKEHQKRGNKSHAKEYPSGNDFMIGGYSFTNCWFS